MKSVQEIIADALAKAARQQSKNRYAAPQERLTHVPGSDPRIKQITPVTPLKSKGYHYVFCTHNKPYWQTCSKCGRDKDLARRNADIVLRACGGAAFFTK